MVGWHHQLGGHELGGGDAKMPVKKQECQTGRGKEESGEGISGQMVPMKESEDRPQKSPW